MTSLTSLRIDTAIQSASFLRLVFHIILVSVMLVLAVLASLSLWQYVLVLFISGSVISYLALSRPILLHLSQPPLDKSVYQDWQLLIRTSRGDALWQAELSGVIHYRFVICFDFIIVEPYQRRLSIAVFHDQVSPEQWRELTILANMVSRKNI